MLLFLLLIACALPSLLILRRVLLRRRPASEQQQWPPGPPAWPVLGHLHLLGSLPHQSLCFLSKSYGPLLGLRLGGAPTIIASSPDMARAILQTHDLVFANRPASAASVHLFFNCGNLGFTPYGPLFKYLRKLVACEFLSPKRLESSRHVREEEVRELMRSVLQTAQQRPHTPVELRASLLATVNNINSRMAIGKRLMGASSVMRSKQDLHGLVEEVMHLLGVFNVGDYIPWLAWLDLQGHVKRMKAAGQTANALMQALIDECREAQKATRALGQGGVEIPDNLLDIMVRAASQSDQDGSITITDDIIKGVLMDLLIGGSDTSTATIEWALAELINNPKSMQKLQDELHRVVGKERLVAERDIPRLPYLSAELKETMRLHPIAPLLIPHESVKECQISTYKIPPKTRAYINMWAIGRDPVLWERPFDFWPERPQNKNLDMKGQKFDYLPFGSGRRRCPGSALGLVNVHLMLGSLVQGFTWSIVSPNDANFYLHNHPLDMSERFMTALVIANPLCAFATPRLMMDLY